MFELILATRLARFWRSLRFVIFPSRKRFLHLFIYLCVYLFISGVVGRVGYIFLLFFGRCIFTNFTSSAKFFQTSINVQKFALHILSLPPSCYCYVYSSSRVKYKMNEKETNIFTENGLGLSSVFLGFTQSPCAPFRTPVSPSRVAEEDCA